jgi:hypothetical protein
MRKTIIRELKIHAPFTMLGALSGVGVMLLCLLIGLASKTVGQVFWTLHPLHVLTSALATAGMYRLHAQGRVIPTFLIGYAGSIGIATLSDCVIPYLGEVMLDLPNRDIHLGFLEKWWLVNPLALAGIGLALLRPRPATKFPHSAHVLLSTWASLFHVMMAVGQGLSVFTLAVIAVFLFLAVWLPCCASDIVFPLLFATEREVMAARY